MKIGVISDIHGNLPALKAVVAELSRRRVSELICAGDILGYYPFVNEVIEELRALGALTIIGNHDHAVVKGTEIDESYSANIAVRYARNAIAPENLNYLSRLAASREVRLGGVDITIFHGTPVDILNGRVRSAADIDPARVRPGLAVGGHTHVRAVIRREGIVYVNPGSCGQPRDFDVRASCALVDLDTMAVEFPRELYDIDAVDARMAEIGFDRRIAWSLYTGEWVGASELSPAAGLARAPGLERSHDCREFRYCLHFVGRETEARYNCYIQDGLARLVSAPRYTNGDAMEGRGADRLKVKATAVAAYKILGGGPTLAREHFEELDASLSAFGEGDEHP